MQRIASLFNKPQKTPSELDVTKPADRQALKREAVDSKTGKVNYSKLEQLLQHYKGARTLYLKKDWLGRQYVSFKPPRLGDQDKAREKLGKFVQSDLMHNRTNLGPVHRAAVQKLMSNLSAHGDSHSTTADFRDAVQTIAGNKEYGPVQQVGLNQTHSPAAQLNTREVGGDGLEAPHQFKFDDPSQVTSKALDDFQHQLRKGSISRPAHEQITSYVNELNAINQGNSARDPSPSELTRLVRFITRGQTQSLNHQPMNQLGDRVFASQYEAAKFLYTETNFLEGLNLEDSEHHKTVFAQVAQLEATFLRVEAAADLEESSRPGPLSVN